MLPRPPDAHEILLPAGPVYIGVTLLAAMFLNFLPWPGLSLLFRPDFVLLLVLFWCINQPRTVGFFLAWLLGLAMDVTNGSLFGQHAFAYVLTLFATILLHRRIQRFSYWKQALHILLLLLFHLTLILLVRLLSGARFPGGLYFVAALTGALLWPGMSLVLRQPLRQTPRADGQ